VRKEAELVQPVGDVQAAVDAVPFWWHSIALGDDIVTPGHHSLDAMEALLAETGLPDVQGKSVLDIGAWDGFYSFEALRRGAGRVVALDHYVWFLDLAEQQRYWRECREQGRVPEPYHEIPGLWQPDRLLGKQGFDTANRALGDRVESVVGEFATMDLAPLGQFDVVLFLGVLYHLEDPFEAIKRLAGLTREVAVISTQAIEVPGFERHALCEFFESSELGADVSNWWAPNKQALTGMCRAAGFERAEVVSAVPENANDSDAVKRERIVVHAYKNA
jgi:tRNA (mo5U34)-methyltransferase